MKAYNTEAVQKRVTPFSAGHLSLTLSSFCDILWLYENDTDLQSGYQRTAEVGLSAPQRDWCSFGVLLALLAEGEALGMPVSRPMPGIRSGVH